jgi:hypothetical protein
MNPTQPKTTQQLKKLPIILRSVQKKEWAVQKVSTREIKKPLLRIDFGQIGRNSPES